MDEHAIEQPAGPDELPPIDLAALDDCRRQTYQSYEGFLRQQLTDLNAARPERWQRDYSSVAAYESSIAPMRERLRAMFGWWVPPEARTLATKHNIQTLADTDELTALRYMIDVLPGLQTYVVELIPRKPAKRGLICQHGYGGTPEGVCGFGPDANTPDYSYRSMGLRAVRHGFHVIAPHHPTVYGQPSIKGNHPLPDHPDKDCTYGKNRLHRLAQMCDGKTLFGLDLMATSRAVDLLPADMPVGLYGLSQGGQTALYAPAVDTRIRASVCAAFFNERLPKMIGPFARSTFLDSSAEDKFFANIISTFGDSDVVSLITPRAFAAEVGLNDGAVDRPTSYAEWQRAYEHYTKLNIPTRCEFIAHAEGHVSATARAFEFLIKNLTP